VLTERVERGRAIGARLDPVQRVVGQLYDLEGRGRAEVEDVDRASGVENVGAYVRVPVTTDVTGQLKAEVGRAA
jgi:hypothetical protein